MKVKAFKKDWVLNLFILGIVFFPFFSYSASISAASLNYSLPGELSVNTSPTYPGPNENVSITLEMYTENLDSSNISWYKNGTLVLQGTGEKKYSFRTGQAGTKTEIIIKITLTSGTTFSKSITIAPASVDIVWEDNSYVPPFYEGKALHPKQGVLKLVAMPEFVSNGKKIAPENLIYKWANDTSVYQNQSGYGKYYFTMSGSWLGKDEEINVTVTDPSSNMTAIKYITIPTTNQEIVFYENSPYYGYLFNTAIKNMFDMASDEAQILAAPFYFTNETSSILQYNWSLNGENLSDVANSRTAIFKKPEGESGSSRISVEITNPNKILQEANASLIMNFKDENQ